VQAILASFREVWRVIFVTAKSKLTTYEITDIKKYTFILNTTHEKNIHLFFLPDTIHFSYPAQSPKLLVAAGNGN
jgi:hypothetical protein